MKKTKIWAILTVLISATSCVDQYGFESQPQLALENDPNGDPNHPDDPGGPVDPNTVVCNPLDPNNQTDASLGIKGTIRYIENYTVGGPYPVTSSGAFLTQGKKIDAEVFLSSLAITPRNFEVGFMNEAGNILKKSDGSPINEWFAIHGESQLQLAPGEPEGLYQIAGLMDDGGTFEIGDRAGNYRTLFSDEFPHNANLACAGDELELKRGEALPIRFGYYQGPRVRVAMTLLWRKVPARNTSDDPDCSQRYGDDHFFTGQKDSNQPKATYTALLSRGWKVLSPQNFRLLNGRNKCVK